MNTPVVERASVRFAIVAALLVVLLAAQAGAAALVPVGQSAETGRVIGRAGFAYLSGIRTFSAAVVWSRLDPQFDLYYGNKALSDQTQMLPMMRLVQMLDPQFVQAYYIASWIVARRGDPAEGFRIAREGIARNPRSGLLRSSYIENMMLEDNERVMQGQSRVHVKEAVKQADAAVRPDMIWTDDAEKLEGYAVIAAAYRIAGMEEQAQAAKAVAAALGSPGTSGGVGGAGHDHDGDGTPDH
jgi:hypothetical protein